MGTTGQEINDEILQHLLLLESQRPPIRRAFHALAESHIVFFKQVMTGDIKKYNTRSSTSGTGGGARDLRVSPVRFFHPLLSQMLSEHGDDPRITHGNVLSHVGRKKFTTTVELWPPTRKRPNEVRISRFYDIPGWAVEEEAFKLAQKQGQMLFYVLEMDIHGTVTAKVLSNQQLSQNSPIIGQHIERLASRAGPRRSIIGAVDVDRNVTVP